MQVIERRIEFRQDPHFSLERFALDGETLTISQKSMGLEKERLLRLVEISAEPEVLHQRFAKFYLVPLLFASGCAVVAWLLLRHDLGPAVIALLPGIFAAAFLWHAILGLKHAEVLAFKNKKGEVVFRLYRPRKVAWQYEEFAERLQSNIKAAQLTSGASDSPKLPG